MSRTRDLYVTYPQSADNGTYRYQLHVDEVKAVASTRTFLTKQEAQIEAEWLLTKLGWHFVTPKPASSPNDR